MKSIFFVIVLLLASGVRADDEISFYDGPRNALADDPSNGTGHGKISLEYRRGIGLFQKKSYAEALVWFQKILVKEPGNAQAHYFAGRCESERGDLREAALDFYVSDRSKTNSIVKAAGDRTFFLLNTDDQAWVKNKLASFKK